MTGCTWALGCPLPVVGAADGVTLSHPAVAVCVAHAASAGRAGWVVRRLRSGRSQWGQGCEPVDLVCTEIDPVDDGDGVCVTCRRQIVDPLWIEMVDAICPETRISALLRTILTRQGPARRARERRAQIGIGA